jgi:hypothetical protein
VVVDAMMMLQLRTEDLEWRDVNQKWLDKNLIPRRLQSWHCSESQRDASLVQWGVNSQTFTVGFFFESSKCCLYIHLWTAIAPYSHEMRIDINRRPDLRGN